MVNMYEGGKSLPEQEVTKATPHVGIFMLSYKDYKAAKKLDKLSNADIKQLAMQTVNYYQTKAPREAVCHFFGIGGSDMDAVLGGNYIIQLKKIENFPEQECIRITLEAKNGSKYDKDTSSNDLAEE